jgi:hypothetical protein
MDLVLVDDHPAVRAGLRGLRARGSRRSPICSPTWRCWTTTYPMTTAFPFA